MSFFLEATKALGLDGVKLSSGYQLINYNGEAVYLEGFVRPILIGNEEILFELKKGKMRIFGEELRIFSLEGQCVIIKGSIKNCEVQA